MGLSGWNNVVQSFMSSMEMKGMSGLSAAIVSDIVLAATAVVTIIEQKTRPV